MNTEEKIQILSENGFETKHTIERFMGKPDIYLKFLGKLETDENMQGLKQAVANGQAKDAFSYAHTLKGVAANLGIDILLEELVPVVEVLRAGSLEGAGSWMPELERRYGQVLDSIRQCQD